MVVGGIGGVGVGVLGNWDMQCLSPVGCARFSWVGNTIKYTTRIPARFLSHGCPRTIFSQPRKFFFFGHCLTLYNILYLF